MHDGEPGKSVDIIVPDMQQVLGDQPAPAEQEHNRQGNDKRRRQDGQNRHDIEKLLPGQLCARNGKGIDIPDDRRHQAHEETQLDAVPESLEKVCFRKDIIDIVQVQLPAVIRQAGPRVSST